MGVGVGRKKDDGGRSFGAPVRRGDESATSEVGPLNTAQPQPAEALLYFCDAPMRRCLWPLLCALLPLALAALQSGDCTGRGCGRRGVVAGFATASLLASRSQPAFAAKKPRPPQVVTNRDGNPVTAESWLEVATARPDLVLGLDGEPYFLLTSDGKVLDYALKAECTHLGCLVAPNAFGTGFECPCHGSNYDAKGGVTRGPAPKALGLAKVEARDDGVLVMTSWDEVDFRQA